MAKSGKGGGVLDFGSAFSYPFNRYKGMLNILWIFLPIFGWFALGGYGVRIVKGFLEGKFKELPFFSFSSDMKLGFFMFVKALPFFIAYVFVFGILDAITQGFSSLLEFLFVIFVMPVLTINFFRKETVVSYFEFDLIKIVFKNFGEYMIALLKSIGLYLIFFIMIIILVGIPALAFTFYIFFAEFYRRYVK
jgi:hypothetical protein